MNLTPKTLAAKSTELQETLAKRDNSAIKVESLKEDLKTEKGYLASLEQLIRDLALEVATGRGTGDQLPLPTEPRSAAERTIPLPLEGNATPAPETPPVEESAEDLSTRNQLRAFVVSYKGQGVTFAQIADAFPGHKAESLRAHLALLAEREEILTLLDGWRGRLVEALAASEPTPEAPATLEPPTVETGAAEPTESPKAKPSKGKASKPVTGLDAAAKKARKGRAR